MHVYPTKGPDTVSHIWLRVLSPNYPDVLALRQGQASRAALRQGPIRGHPLQLLQGTVSVWAQK
jgi:hypothetical protein